MVMMVMSMMMMMIDDVHGDEDTDASHLVVSIHIYLAVSPQNFGFLALGGSVAPGPAAGAKSRAKAKAKPKGAPKASAGPGGGVATVEPLSVAERKAAIGNLP